MKGFSAFTRYKEIQELGSWNQVLKISNYFNTYPTSFSPKHRVLSILNSFCVCVLSHVWLFATPWTVRSPPGYSIHVILQARIPKWTAPIPVLLPVPTLVNYICSYSCAFWKSSDHTRYFHCFYILNGNTYISLQCIWRGLLGSLSLLNFPVSNQIFSLP